MSPGRYDENDDIDVGPGDTLNAKESTDSDEVHNADGDEPIEPAEKWSGSGKFGLTAGEAAEGESLDRKLAAERPDIGRDVTDREE